MAEPTLADVMNAVNQCTSSYAALAKQLADQGAALAKLAPPKVVDTDNDGMKATKAEIEQLKAQISSMANNVSQFKKERALMGFKGSDAERAKLAAGAESAEDIEKLSAAKKTYVQLVDEACSKNAKLKRSDAHTLVQNTPEGREAYSLHLSSKGVVRATA